MKTRWQRLIGAMLVVGIGAAAFAPGSVHRPTLRPNRRMMAGFHPPSPPARFHPASDPRLDELDTFFRATL